MDADDLAEFQELEADLAALAEESDSDDDEAALASKRRLRSLGSASIDGWVGVCVCVCWGLRVCVEGVCVSVRVCVLGGGSVCVPVCVWGGGLSV